MHRMLNSSFRDYTAPDALVRRRRFPENPTLDALLGARQWGVVLSVMVVDDDDRFRGLAKRMLAGCGYRTEGEAWNVSDALQQTAQHMPDIVLVDVGLPDGDGFELTKRLSALSSTARIVLVSADSDAASQQDAKDAGAVGFVPKSDLSCAVLHLLLDTE